MTWRNSQAGQRGQTLVLMAIAVVALCGMIGLVIDGGLAEHDKLVSQSAADGAALAAAYNIQAYPFYGSFSAANAAAGRVVAQDGLSGPSLTMSYLHQDGTVASNPMDSVYTVQAKVSFSAQTTFLAILGIKTLSVSSTARVIEPKIRGTCVFCLMNQSGTDIHLNKNTTIQGTNGTLYVDSSYSQAVKFDGNGNTITAPGILLVGGWQQSSGNYIEPTPETGVPLVGDPDALAPIPSVAGPVLNYTAAPSVTLNPGIYNGINIPAGDTVVMNPGTYVMTSNLVISGTLVANGVTIYLACSAYPTPCTNGGGKGQTGAIFDDNIGSITITPPTSGTYQGMSIFADRNNVGSNILDQGSLELVSGTWYTLRMPFTTIHSNITITVGNLIADSFNLVQGTTMILNYIPGSSYFPPGGFVPQSRLTLAG